MAPSPRTPQARIGFLLYRAGRQVARSYAAHVAPLGVRPEHVGILTAVATTGPQHIRSLSRLLEINRQTVVDAVNDLEARGAVVRTPNPDDRRVVLVEATAAGHGLLHALEERVAEYDRAVESIGTAAERAAVARWITRLIESGALDVPSPEDE